MNHAVSPGIMMAEALLRVYHADDEGNRKRFEAIAQHQLGFVLRLEGELDRFSRRVLRQSPRGPLEISEEKLSASRKRFDHEVTSDDGVVAVIEDKIEAGFTGEQIETYVKDIALNGKKPVVLILAPVRRIQAIKDQYEHGRDVLVKSWDEVSSVMAEGSPHPDLWLSLGDFAEQAGFPSLGDLGPASIMNDSEVARDAGDLVRTAKNVARAFVGNDRASLGFSFHRSNVGPWIQAGLTNNQYGIELDLSFAPYLWIGKNRDDEWHQLRIGLYRGGELSQAALERIDDWKTHASRKSSLKAMERYLYGLRTIGRPITPEAADALKIAASVFQTKYLTGATVGADRVHSVPGNRLAADLWADDRRIRAYIGPEGDEDWERVCVTIEGGESSESVTARSDEGGAEYARRVWTRLRVSLHR